MYFQLPSRWLPTTAAVNNNRYHTCKHLFTHWRESDLLQTQLHGNPKHCQTFSLKPYTLVYGLPV